MWSSDDELLERLQAIEAVSHAHPGVRVIEHALADLVRFLSAGRVERAVAVDALVQFLGSEPPRVGAVETLEFVVASLDWPELREGLAGIRDSTDANFRNRDLARSALAAFEQGWHGSAFRTFRPGE